MRAALLASVALAVALLLAPPAWAQPDGTLQFPRIAGAGGVIDRGTRPAPEPGRTRRVLFDLDSAAGPGIDPGLESVARLLNLYALAGVPDGRVEVVVLLRGGATALALQAGAHERRFGAANPNATLVDALLSAGVRIEVCGQASHRKGFAAGELDPRIPTVLAALVRREALLAEGYVLAP
ncbi:MAG: hypothetical protein A2190_05065 [Lysobacterales bacterium RIFOXYA1_FULL_69_10]|nr:MAG: hypothetical protein A2190_05065 [Xanthomonadales bacterium RIFOXYA1_FULL_69_10]